MFASPSHGLSLSTLHSVRKSPAIRARLVTLHLGHWPPVPPLTAKSQLLRVTQNRCKIGFSQRDRKKIKDEHTVTSIFAVTLTEPEYTSVLRPNAHINTHTHTHRHTYTHTCTYTYTYIYTTVCGTDQWLQALGGREAEGTWQQGIGSQLQQGEAGLFLSRFFSLADWPVADPRQSTIYPSFYLLVNYPPPPHDANVIEA